MEGQRKLARGVSARLTPAEGRRFGLLVGGAFLVLGVLLGRRAHTVGATVALVLGSALFAGGLAAPVRLRPIYRSWMALATVISKVTTPVVMGIIFFLVLTPIGVIARLLGHRPLSRPQGETSYWQSRPPGAGRGEMDHQF